MPLDHLLPAWKSVRCAVIGMVHLGALPGSPGFGGDVASVARRAIADAEALADGGVDGVIVSGTGTGKETEPARVKAVKAAAGEHPVFVGSGVTVESVGKRLQSADGVIVGTALKCDGDVAKPVDSARVAALVEAIRRR